MDVSVDQSRNNSLAMQIDSPGLRSDEFSYFLSRTYSEDLSVGNGQGLSGSELRVYFDDISVNKYAVRRLAYGLSNRVTHSEQNNHDNAKTAENLFSHSVRSSSFIALYHVLTLGGRLR